MKNLEEKIVLTFLGMLYLSVIVNIIINGIKITLP